MATEARVVISGDASSLVTAAGRGEQAVGRLSAALGGLQALSARALSLTALGVGAAAAASHLVSVTKGAVEAADALNKLSQKTGLGVEELSKLQYAAELSDVSTELLQKGMTALSASVASAATGTGQSADLFRKLGIEVRNANGEIRPSSDILNDLSDIFAEMPDGLEKTALAAELFGRKIGPDLIPFLNQGAAGLKAMADEAERFGVVISGDFAKKSEEVNDNLKRLGLQSKATGIAIAADLLPPLNRLLGEYLDAKLSGLSFFEALFGIGLSDPTKGVAQQIDTLTRKLGDLRKARDAALASGDGAGADALGEDLRKTSGLLDYYLRQQKRSQGEAAEDLNAKLVSLGQQRIRKLAELEQLRAIAAGKASADILTDDAKRTETQIQNATKLRDALRTAWESSREEARKAGEEAAKLFEKAADIRQAGADKANARRDKSLTPEEADNKAIGEFRNAAAEASFNAAVAEAARLDGRTQVAKAAAEKAAKAAEQAAKAADRIQNDSAAAPLIEQAADLQAKAVEAQARQEQARQKSLQEQAEAQRASLAELDGQLEALRQKALQIKIAPDIGDAQKAFAAIDAEYQALKARIESNPITVPVSVPGAAPAPPAGDATGFAFGGYTGPGGKFTPAGIVHAEEFVVRREVVRQSGALAMLMRLNRDGMAGLNGYASGGLVSRIGVPALAAARPQTPTPVNLHLDGRRYPMAAAPDVVAEITAALAREALRRGGRR